ncbi:MAG: hypothetical protein KKH92_09010 [Firmicutes bacterium]|nr:hypothetical protein [Bacillota bacterium]
MYKKLYLWGLSLTLVMMIIRLSFLFRFITLEVVISEVVSTLFVSHFILALVFFIARIRRFIHSENFISFAMTGVWLSVIIATIAGLVFYVASIVTAEVDMSIFNGTFMAIIGLWMENHMGRMEELEEEIKKMNENK